MATKIRLKRCGAKKQPHYRVVVMHSAGTRDGRAIEEIGYHNPLTDPPTTVIKAERALHWLMVGAQPTDTVADLLRKLGIMDQLKAARGVAPAAQPASDEPAPSEAPAAEAAPVASESEV